MNMKKIIKNKKGIMPLIFIFGIIAFLVVIYLLLYLPIPKFAEIRSSLNYLGILIFWFAFQGLLIYAYYHLGKIGYKGFTIYKVKLLNFSNKINAMATS